MITIINEMIAESLRKITNIFSAADILSIDEAEKAFWIPTEELVCGLLSQYYEQLDEAVRDAKEYARRSVWLLSDVVIVVVF